MAVLIILSPDGQSQKNLGVFNSIGRHPNNTHQVLDRIVSKEHCTIEFVNGVYVLKDLSSLNGTFVNGNKINEIALKDGDKITIGSSQLIFKLELSTQGDTAIKKIRRPTEEYRKGEEDSSRVTISKGLIDSCIRTKLAPMAGEHSFLSENAIQDEKILRADYEKLRANYEMSRAIAGELKVEELLSKILQTALSLLPADRGVIFLCDESGDLKPRAVKRKGDPELKEEVVISTTVLDEVLKDRAAVLSSDASLDSRFQAAKSVIMQGIRSTMAVPLLHSDEVLGVMVLDSQFATNAFAKKDLQLFQNIASQAAIAIKNSFFAKKLEQEAVTRERFKRLLSPAIAEQVVSGHVEVKKGGELRQATVLFTDIRGFTAMSEKISPTEIVDMLNEYFEAMVEIIFKYEGTLDKFIGDEIMAIFGAPVPYDDAPQRAINAGLEMFQALKRLNEKRQEEKKDIIQVGIGINTGEMVAGYLGSSQALEYTVIGDAVNIGSRLCSLAKAGQLLISEFTYHQVKELYEIEELPLAKLKGKGKALRIFNVIGDHEHPMET